MKFPERPTISAVAGADLNPLTRLDDPPERPPYPGGGTAR
jgi:hypothetical protein